MSDPLDLLICTTCGVQYSETDQAQRQTCPVCDDPRQYVAADGYVPVEPIPHQEKLR
jgi:predicted  nucleic acid-binding Zn-ribbon protein